ncbi:MAG TPA: translation elongation factor Ts [Bacteroidia bacterium]|nr:translation elongation factor Ts [Bacteroidia bacterium]
MATITAKEINELRQATGAGMMDCKKALEQADGDRDAAIDYLRKKGQKIADNRQDRDANEGSVFVQHSHTAAVLVELNCETDFVARNEYFQGLGQGIARVAFESHPADVAALLPLQLDGQSISDHLLEAMSKIAEKIQIRSFVRVEGERVVTYIHPGARVGVAVAFVGVGSEDIDAIGKDVAMQIAAMKPISVDQADVPAEIVAKELQIGRERALAEGKPEAIVDKIAQGVLQKYFKENTLLAQEFVKDTSKSVAQYLKEANPNLKVKAFARVQLGA